MRDTLVYLKETDFPAIKRGKLQTLQVNLGYLCNQQCLHCHVDASPRRTEVMGLDNIKAVVKFLEYQGIRILDLTGGAPEMNPNFRYLVKAATDLGIEVIDRCNLTILIDKKYSWLTEFLADNRVHVVASMPCYLEQNVDAQRGKGVFVDSINGLIQLNKAGYGVTDTLKLDLVYNPQGPHLPPSQVGLEQAYKRELKERFNVVFDQLLTITNMPIKRFGSTLLSRGEFDEYMNLLKTSYSEKNLDAVMCRTLLSIDWLGYAYDCHFNQMLKLKSSINQGRVHISELYNYDFENRDIVVMDHCYGCTAGQGSSCGGALAD